MRGGDRCLSVAAAAAAGAPRHSCRAAPLLPPCRWRRRGHMGHITAARCNVYHKAIIVICDDPRGAAAGEKGSAARRSGGERAALARTAGRITIMDR